MKTHAKGGTKETKKREGGPPPSAVGAPTSRPPPEGWWEAAFALIPSASDLIGHPCGHHQMLILIAYDISDPKRLAKVAHLCEDHGIRVQYSLFECRLEADRLEDFWLQLEELIDPASDRLVAYRICVACAKEILTAGTMQNTSRAIAYVY